MAETKPTPAGAGMSEQEQQFAQAIGEFAGKVEKIGERLSQADAKTQADFKEACAQISKLSDEVKLTQARYRERFEALVAEHLEGGVYRGPFASAQQAEQFGRICLAIGRRDRAGIERLTAAVQSAPGASGGYLVLPQMLDAIIRNVEEYSIIEQDALRWPMAGPIGSMLKRTGGMTCYFPELGVAPAASDPAVGTINLQLTMHCVLSYVDRSLLVDALAIPLANFIVTELAYALAVKQDSCGLIGDGSSTYARVNGLFKRADLLSVTADSGDNTFQEVIDATTKYLGKCAGTLPQWADAGDGARWYMHRSIFFGYMGARDSQNRPLTELLVTGQRPQLLLAGYPVRIAQAAPALSASAASTCLAVLANLRETTLLARHVNGVEIRESDQYKFAERQVAYLLECRQTIAERDGNAGVRLITAAS